MKKLSIFLGVVLAVGCAGSALAVDVTLHGDFNNRFNLYTNQSQVYAKAGSGERASKPVQKDSNSTFWGDAKYRLWTEMATNDGAVKGVYGLELGAIRYGQTARGGGFSGDGVNIETRWAYTDFQLPFVPSKARVQMGLMPWTVNSFVWDETAMGIQLKGDAGPVDYTVGWARGKENFPTNTDQNAFQDADGFLLRGDLKPAEGTKLGLFALWQRQDAFNFNSSTTTTPSPAATFTAANNEIKLFGDSQYSIYTLGTDGSFTTPTGAGNFFLNWDAIYQGGTLDKPGNLDVSAYLLHADLGLNVGKARFTYTGWIASGDDDATDGDINNFLATDVDRFDSVVLFEGGYTDDNYFTEAPYVLDKGLILNKLAADLKATEKTAVGAAVLYLLTAEELANGEDKLGTELDAYVSHQLYPNVEVALNAGYLFSDDGMRNFSTTGDKEDIVRVTSRVRYKF